MDVLRYRVATIKVVLVHAAAITFVYAACHDIGGKDRVVHLHAGKREDVGLAQIGDADLAVAAIHERQNDELAVVTRQVAVTDHAGRELERTYRLLAHGVQHSFSCAFRACFRDRADLLALALCFRLGDGSLVGFRQVRSDDRRFHRGIHVISRHQFDELAQVAMQVLLRGPGATRHAGAPFGVTDPLGTQEHAGVESFALEGVSALHGLELDNRERSILLVVLAHTQMDRRLVTARDCVLAHDTVCDVGRIVVAIRVQAEEEGGTFFLATVFASFCFFSDLPAIDCSLGGAFAAFGRAAFAAVTFALLSHVNISVRFQ